MRPKLRSRRKNNHLKIVCCVKVECENIGPFHRNTAASSTDWIQNNETLRIAHQRVLQNACVMGSRLPDGLLLVLLVVDYKLNPFMRASLSSLLVFCL